MSAEVKYAGMVNGGDIGSPSRTDDTRKTSAEIAQRTVADILAQRMPRSMPDEFAGADPEELAGAESTDFDDVTIEIDVNDLTDLLEENVREELDEQRRSG